MKDYKEIFDIDSKSDYAKKLRILKKALTKSTFENGGFCKPKCPITFKTPELVLSLDNDHRVQIWFGEIHITKDNEEHQFLVRHITAIKGNLKDGLTFYMNNRFRFA